MMNQTKNSTVNSQSGQFLLLVVIFIALIMLNSLLLISRSNVFFQTSAYTTEAAVAVNLAEAGLDKTVATLNRNPNYSGGTFSLGGGEIETKVQVDPNGSSSGKVITATAYIPSKQGSKVKRQVKVSVDKVTGLKVPYAIYGGLGGVYMGNTAQVTNGGSVFSSGPILMGRNTRVDGSVIAAAGTPQVPEIEQSDCNFPPDLTCEDFELGGLPNNWDGSQSFIPTASGQLTKAMILLKHILDPGEGLNVHINRSANIGGRDVPDPNQSLGKGGQVFIDDVTSISIQAVSADDYAWTEVKFDPAINLVAGTKYWLSVDGKGCICAHAHYYWRYVKGIGSTPTSTPTPTPTPSGSGGTFGFTGIGGSTDSGDFNTMNGTRFTTGAVAGAVISISVYIGAIDTNVANRSFQTAIYTNNGSENPATLVASSSTGTLVANSWNTIPISANLLPNTKYWLFYNTNASSSSFNDLKYNSDSSLKSVYKTRTFGTWPASFGAPGGVDIAKFSIYATFATSPTPTPIITPTPIPTPPVMVSYQNGEGIYSNDFETPPPGTAWYDLGGDYLFKLYITPNSGSIKTGPNYIEGIIDGSTSSKINKDTFASRIRNLVTAGQAYYQTIDINSKVGGIPCPNSKCHPGATDVLAESDPITDAMVTSWRNEATTGGTINNSVVMSSDCTGPWGPKKINGNLTMNGCDISLKSPIYVTGNMTIQSDNNITLDASFGKTSGVILVDGTITVEGANNTFQGTGVAGSTIILASESNSTTGAIQVLGSDNLLILVARQGTIYAQNTNTFDRLIGKTVHLRNSSAMTIQNNPDYLSLNIAASGGEYEILKGTYQTK